MSPGLRLYLTDLALERARLALDVPAAFASAPTPATAAATANLRSCKPASNPPERAALASIGKRDKVNS